MRRTINLETQIIDILNYRRSISVGEDEPDSKRERLKKIMKIGLIQELTDKQRECMLKRYVNGMSVKDIADAMNLKPSSVYKHIRVAKKRMARLYNYL